MSLIKFDGAAFRSSLQTTIEQLGKYGKAGAAAVTLATYEYLQKLLKEMKQLAPHRTYELIRSGHIEGPSREGEWTVLQIVWDVPYAHIQDKGGAIFPKHVTAAYRDTRNPFKKGSKIRGALGRYISRKTLNTAKLFVPLRPGVKAIKDPAMREAMGYRYGIDFIFAKMVTIPGSKYITGVLDKHRTHHARDIGARAQDLWTRMAEAGKK